MAGLLSVYDSPNDAFAKVMNKSSLNGYTYQLVNICAEKDISPYLGTIKAVFKATCRTGVTELDAIHTAIFLYSCSIKTAGKGLRRLVRLQPDMFKKQAGVFKAIVYSLMKCSNTQVACNTQLILEEYKDLNHDRMAKLLYLLHEILDQGIINAVDCTTLLTYADILSSDYGVYFSAMYAMAGCRGTNPADVEINTIGPYSVFDYTPGMKIDHTENRYYYTRMCLLSCKYMCNMEAFHKLASEMYEHYGIVFLSDKVVRDEFAEWPKDTASLDYTVSMLYACLHKYPDNTPILDRVLDFDNAGYPELSIFAMFR